MNSFEELLDNGIEKYTAADMLESYRAKIGTMNGVYVITDITYDFEQRGRDVTLKCSKCGKEIHRMMISGRNKWCELIKHCTCEKDAERKAKSEKIFREKKERYDTMIRRIGKVLGDYTVSELLDIDSSKPKYKLVCNKCGAVRIVLARPFTVTDFHCVKHYEREIKFDESYIGKTNNYLKVVDIVRNKRNERMFLCQCTVCGKLKEEQPVFWERGIVKSCGCQSSRLLSEALTIHGESDTRLYRVWNSMKQRCENPKSDSYANYGGRGISICPEWHKWETFRDWAFETGYDKDAARGECTIDRIDVNGNYEPSNCRWVDMVVQANNKRPYKRRRGNK